MQGPSPVDITALILAGGQGRRLGGRNKALIRVGGEPGGERGGETAGETMIDRVAGVLRPRVARILVSVAAPVSWTELETVIDEREGQGPLAGIAAGLLRAPGWLLAVAVDMPHLRGVVLDLLLARAGSGCDAAAFRLGGWPEPLVALWGPACAKVVQRRLAAGQRKVAGALLDPEIRVAWIDEPEVRALDPELRTFCNVNDAGDVAAL